MRKKLVIGISVTCGLIVAAGLGVLIWWLVTRGGDDEPYTVVELEGDGIGSLTYTAAFTRIRDVGNVFWWFYPTVASAPLTRPLVVWLDGVTGVPPSLLANLGMIGPYDVNFESRTDSWINQCNLLFIDAPIGTGYSTPSDESRIPSSVDENVEHIITVLESFYSVHEEYIDTPLYIFGQGDGAGTAVTLAIKLNEQTATNYTFNIKGIALGNGIISPALAMTKLGFYLEELGYIDSNGRNAVETLSQDTNNLVNTGVLQNAFDNFILLTDFINENAGAVAVNLGHIVERLTRNSSENRDYFNQRSYIKSVLGVDGAHFMDREVGPALGIDSSVTYDAYREEVIQAVRNSFMVPCTGDIQYILQSTNLTVSIYNGNLDAVSNTPGQLEWVDNLQWEGQTEFRNSARQTLVVNRLVEGYFRETERLKFYWINAAGQSAPLDNPVALNRILPRIITPSKDDNGNEDGDGDGGEDGDGDGGDDEEPYTIVELEGEGIGSTTYKAAYTRIRDVGNVFWWFYPTVASAPLTRPLVIWLDGVTGLPPSLLANLGMIGPYDFNFESRSDSWVNQCNLLFIDAPLGTGYSTPLDSSKIPKNVDENVEHLRIVLESFYAANGEYTNTPVYIFGQGDGAKTAVALAIKLNDQTVTNFTINIKGVALGNGIISPALAMTKLGFYLEELGYIDEDGRNAIETLSQDTNALVNGGSLDDAFDNFISLSDFVNENAGAVAVNLGHIVEKLTRNLTENRDYFNQRRYIRSVSGIAASDFMNNLVSPVLGIDANVNYDDHRDTVIGAFRSSFMSPFTNEIEYILQSTDITVSIYNGNLDAVSNTPGQLEWVDNLQWYGQTEFRNSARQTLVVNRLVEGYFRETERLKFYWINAAGQSAPLDNPIALNRILPRIVGTETSIYV